MAVQTDGVTVRKSQTLSSPKSSSEGVIPPDSIPVDKTNEVGMQTLESQQIAEGVERKKSLGNRFLSFGKKTGDKLVNYSREQAKIFDEHMAPVMKSVDEKCKQLDKKLSKGRRESSPAVFASGEPMHDSPPVSPRRASMGPVESVSSSTVKASTGSADSVSSSAVRVSVGPEFVSSSTVGASPVYVKEYSPSSQLSDQAAMAREAVCCIFRKIFQEENKANFSIEKYAQALEEARQIFDKEDPFLGECLLGFGKIQAGLKKIKEARLSYLEARENFIVNDKENLIYDVSIAMMETKWEFHTESALEIARSGFFDEPLGYGHDALRVSIKLYGENHNHTAKACIYLSQLYNMTKNKRFALEYVDRAITILNSPKIVQSNAGYLGLAIIQRSSLAFIT